MNLDIVTLDNMECGTLKVSESFFSRDYNEDLVHQVVISYMSGSRQGTKAQKNRSAVRGGGKKPWRQKGTGRARAGTIRSPIWVGGGRTFAAKFRNYSHKVNRKMYRLAMQCIISELIRQDRLIIISSLLSIDEPKTKLLLDKLNSFILYNSIMVTESFDKNLFLASRNIPNFDIIDVTLVDPLSLVSHIKVIITIDALKKFEEILR